MAYNILVSDVQHSVVSYIMKWSPCCLVTIYYHIKFLQYYWLYPLCYMLHPCDTYFRSSNFLIPFTYFTHLPISFTLAIKSLFFVSMSLFLFYICSFFFFFRFQVHPYCCKWQDLILLYVHIELYWIHLF